MRRDGSRFSTLPGGKHAGLAARIADSPRRAAPMPRRWCAAARAEVCVHGARPRPRHAGGAAARRALPAVRPSDGFHVGAAPPLRPLRYRSSFRPRPRPPRAWLAAHAGIYSAADRGPLAFAAAWLRWPRRRRSCSAGPRGHAAPAAGAPRRAPSCAFSARARWSAVWPYQLIVSYGCTPDAPPPAGARAHALRAALLVQQTFALLCAVALQRAAGRRPPPFPAPFPPTHAARPRARRAECGND